MLSSKLNDYTLYCLVRANYCSASCDNDCVWHNDSSTSTVMLPVTFAVLHLITVSKSGAFVVNLHKLQY